MYRQRIYSAPTKAPARVCRCGDAPASHKGFTGTCIELNCLCLRYRQLGRDRYFKEHMGLQHEGFDSKMERNYIWDLEFKATQPDTDILEIKRQVPLEIRVYGVKLDTYIADAVVTYKDGRTEIIETKGMQSDYFKLKWKLFSTVFHRENPNLIIRLELGSKRRRW